MPIPLENDDPHPRTPENDVQAMLRFNGERDAQRARQKAAAQSKSPAPADNDVLAMLRQNQAHEASRAVNQEIPYVPKKSRRRRDYILGMVGGNLLIIALVIAGRGNMVTLIFGFSGIILLSAGFTWVMFFVMEDY